MFAGLGGLGGLGVSCAAAGARTNARNSRELYCTRPDCTLARSASEGWQHRSSLALRASVSTSRKRTILSRERYNSSRNRRGCRAAIAFSSSTDCQSVASSLLLVDLHCGHCRAALLPFGTVGNGRFGPAGRDCSPRNSPNNVRETGDRRHLPERPGGCCAHTVPVPFFPQTRACRSIACLSHAWNTTASSSASRAPEREVVLPSPARSLPASRAPLRLAEIVGK